MLAGGVPKHLRVAEVALGGGQYGVAGVLGEGLSTVGAVRNALHLGVAPRRRLGRRVESHYRTGAEAGGVVSVNYGRTAEHRAPGVGQQGVALVLPVHQVGRRRVPPVHVAPRRAVGIVLEIQVPHAVLVEHSVRVVHPSVGRSVVVQRTVLLLVRHVERVGELQFLPAKRALGHTLHVYLDVAADKGREVERHIVVYTLARQAHVHHRSYRHVGLDDAQLGLGRVVLYGQQQAARRLADGQDVLFVGKMEHLQLRRGLQQGRRESRRKCKKNVLQSHGYLLFYVLYHTVSAPSGSRRATAWQSMACQYAVFRSAKGGLSACKRRPFTARKAVSWIATNCD